MNLAGAYREVLQPRKLLRQEARELHPVQERSQRLAVYSRFIRIY
jgi:hypothetical protein